MATAFNQVESGTLIEAPRAKVWRMLTDIAEFGHWFHCETSAVAFEPGARIQLSSTYPGEHYGVKFWLEVAEMIPEELFSWRWHPNAHEGTGDLSEEPMTLVTFRLEDAEGGTRVTVTETGFDGLLESRRRRAFESNTQGWKTQIANLEQYCRSAS